MDVVEAGTLASGSRMGGLAVKGGKTLCKPLKL